MVITNINWTDDLGVGVPRMDEDHKQLIGILNKLFAACSAYVGDEVLQQVTDELESYTKNHFAREEELLESQGYPSLEVHKFQRQKLTKELHEYMEKVKTGAADGLSADVVTFLREWLIVHIKEHDHQYATYLGEKHRN